MMKYYRLIILFMLSIFNTSLLVKMIGFPATLIHGDLLVLDRWRYLRRRLPMTLSHERLLDVGCGTGAFTIGAARRGYQAIGLSWDTRNQTVAKERARLCSAPNATFLLQDVRHLDDRRELIGQFNTVLCCENIEHILDDQKLMIDISNCLCPGGFLLLTSPNFFYRAISPSDNGPFSRTEDGGHVRRGYTPSMLNELCANAELAVEEITYCGGFFSQKITALIRVLGGGILIWSLTFPLRVLPIIFDTLITKFTSWPSFTICVMAYKPRSKASPAL